MLQIFELMQVLRRLDNLPFTRLALALRSFRTDEDLPLELDFERLDSRATLSVITYDPDFTFITGPVAISVEDHVCDTLGAS